MVAVGSSEPEHPAEGKIMCKIDCKIVLLMSVRCWHLSRGKRVVWGRWVLKLSEK